MKIIRAKADNRVLYLFADAAELVLAEQLLTEDFVASDISDETHEIVTGVAAPAMPFVGGGLLAYDGAWSILDDEAYAEQLDALRGAPFAERKQAALDAVLTRRDALLAGGFTVPAETSADLGGRVLQTRNIDDRTAWLTSQAAYSAAVVAGQGALANAIFRPEDNITTTVSYAEGLNVLLAMAAWGASIYAHSWDLKDAIDAADRVAFEAIDIENGWPA